MGNLEQAARALAAFEPLAALQIVALRNEPHAVALRGVAMAQLGEYEKARKLLRRAARALERIDPPARARCLGALGEIALVERDLVAAKKALDLAAAALGVHGDRFNAAFVRLQRARCAVHLGALDEAEEIVGRLGLHRAPARLRAIGALIEAEIAVRRLRARDAANALERARRAAELPQLVAEVERATTELAAPVARLVRRGNATPVSLAEVEALPKIVPMSLIVDACRRQIRKGAVAIDLASRPVLLALACALGTHGAASRDELVAAAFGAKRATESMRARLRVEIGRLRRILRDLAPVEATAEGFAVRAEVLVLLAPHDGEASQVLALLRSGGAWSTSALGLAVGGSQRVVQRTLAHLAEAGRVEAIGRGRAARWIATPADGFATTLLLLSRPPNG